MSSLLSFTILGIFTGAAYAIAASGLVLTYSTTRVFNVAHGAFGMVLAFIYWDFSQRQGIPAWVSLALVLLVLRSFTQGAAALTGVEAISNGVPAFRKPKSRNAATTLLMLGAIATSMFAGITWLALATDVKVAEHNEDLIGLPPGTEQKTVIAQVAQATFSNVPPAGSSSKAGGSWQRTAPVLPERAPDAEGPERFGRLGLYFAHGRQS